MNTNLSFLRLAIASAQKHPSPPIEENPPFTEDEEMKDLMPWDNDWIDIGGES